MASVNKVILVGSLGRDTELRTFPNGDQVANVSIATSEKWRDKNTGENKEATEWHRLVFTQKLAEIAGQYLKKGSQIYVEGKISTRKWTDKDGSEKYSTEIKVQNMTMLGGKPEGGSQQPIQHQRQQATAPRAASGFEDMDDTIPFLDPLKSRAFSLAI